MRNVEKAYQWLARANSNLAQARLGEGKAEVLLDDLCFQAQQAAEKALKALCVFLDMQLPRTHDIGYLIDQIRDAGLEIPGGINQARDLATEVCRWVRQRVGSEEPQP